MTLGSPSAPSGPARWSYTWDSAGRLASITYPRRDEGNATSVTYGYSRGAPTSVTADFRDPFAPGDVKTVRATLDYDAAGSVHDTTVFTSANNGMETVRVSVERDASGLSRPGTWSFQRWAPSPGTWASQELRTYTYDGSGNIRLIGSSLTDRVASYTYDSRGRLTGDALGARPSDPLPVT